MLYFWILFNLFAVGMLVLDLRVFHRRGHVVKIREALTWGAMWIGLAATFAAVHCELSIIVVAIGWLLATTPG